MSQYTSWESVQRSKQDMLSNTSLFLEKNINLFFKKGGSGLSGLPSPFIKQPGKFEIILMITTIYKVSV